MKKLYCILTLLIISVSFSQTKSVPSSPIIMEKDISDAGDSKFCVKEIFLYDADMKKQRATFTMTCDSNQYKISEMKVETIDKMITNANLEGMQLVKNKYTYASKSLVMSYMPDLNKWQILLEYVAQNDYGALKNSFVILIFDNSGNFLRTLN